MNSYLVIAAKVLSEARQPLSARHILRAAYQLQIVPRDLYGKTQHKTLHARLAEDILRNRSRSEFVRTGPGRFFLRRLLSDPDIPTRLRREYPAPPRSDQLKRFHVLCLPRQDVVKAERTHGKCFPMNVLRPLRPRYRRLAEIAVEDELVYVQVLVVLRRLDQILMCRKYRIADEPLKGNTSLGFVGYMKREDHTLFSEDDYGIHEAATRTLLEQLPVTNQGISELEVLGDRSTFQCLTDTAAGQTRNAMAAVVAYRVPPTGEVDSVLAILDDHVWLDTFSQINDLDSLDPWSRLLIETEEVDQLFQRAERP